MHGSWYLLPNALISDQFASPGAVTLAGPRIEDASWGTSYFRAHTGAGVPVEDLGMGAREWCTAGAARNGDGAWEWDGAWEGNGCVGNFSLPLSNWQNPRSPETEAVLVFAVGARCGLNAPLPVLNVATLLAAARQVVLEGDGAEANLPPAAPDEPVDEDTAVPPHLLPGNAGWVSAEQVVTAATVDRGPVEHVGATK